MGKLSFMLLFEV